VLLVRIDLLPRELLRQLRPECTVLGVLQYRGLLLPA
jgi:hypothetical protein